MFIFKWLRNGLLLLIFLVLGIGLFMLGFQHSFPGQVIAQYLEQQITARIPIQVKIEPLVWRNLHRVGSERVAVLAPPSVSLSHLFVVENIELELLPRLAQLPGLQLEQWIEFPVEQLKNALEQDIDLHGQAYGGEIYGTLNYAARKNARLLIRDMSLDHIPALHLFPYALLKGSVWLQGSIRNLQELQSGKSQIPKGKVIAKLQNIQIQPKNLAQLIPGGLDLPTLSFPEIQLEVDYDKFLTIRKLQLKGSLEGTIEGKIFLNPRDLLASRVQLHLQLKLSKKLEQALGPMTLLLQGMQCGDVMDFDLSGTLERLQPPRKRACS